MPSLPRLTRTPDTGSLAALRRWWWLPLIGAIAGAMLGLLAGSRSTHTATALVQSKVMGTEAQAVAQGAQTALAGLQTPEVYALAAKERGADVDDLTTRTRTAIVGDSEVISVTVTAPTADQAVADANAVAEAGVEVANQRVDANLTEVRKRMLELLDGGQLATLPKAVKSGIDPASTVPNGQAELSRQSAIGQALGQAQSAMITGQGRVPVMEPAGKASVARDVSKAIAAMSLVGGLLLGLAAAVMLGSRRTSVSSADQLRRLYPDVTVVPRTELAAVIDADLDRYRRALVVGTNEHSATLADAVRAAAGARPLDILAARPGSPVIERLAKDPDTLVLVAAPTGMNVSDLDAIGHHAGDDTVVVTD